VRILLAGILLGLAACASTRHEPPPEVAPQPPPITASEAVAEGREAESRDAALSAAAARAPRAQRRRPTDNSVQQIRSRYAAAPLALDFGQRLDQGHDRVYTWMQGFVEATDRRFAAREETLVPVPAAPFRLGATVESLDRSDGMKFDLDLDFDVTLGLPNIEKRLGIFITSGELDEVPRAARSNPSLRAGLRYQLLRYLDFDVGAQLHMPPSTFASLKWTRQFELGEWDFYPLAKLFADTHESVGYVAAATFDRWSGRRLLRSSTQAKWRHDRDSTEWTQTFIHARAQELIVPDRYGSYIRADDIGRGWGARLQAGGKSTNAVTHYEAGVFLRRRTPNRWLYWYVEPLVRWDRDYHWTGDPGVRIGLDALFWDLARPAP
jgi:hypothetical protein